MGGLFDSLTVGGNGMQAQQYGAQVTGANIANANADGNHRNDPHITSGQLRYGVEVPRTERAVNQFYDNNVNTQLGSSSYANTRLANLQTVQSAVGDLSATGIGAQMDAFLNGWNNLSATPQDSAVRNDLMGRLQALVTRINQAASQLSGAQTQADQQVVQTVQAANAQISTIAGLNKQINDLEAGGQPANNLRDQRDYAVNQLAESVGATATVDSITGQFVVMAGEGIVVVEGNNANLLGTRIDPTTGLHTIELPNTSMGAIDSRFDQGQLGALLQLRDSDIANQITALDQFAYDLTGAVNGVNSVGYGLDGVTGRNLLTATTVVAGSAASFSIDAATVGNSAAFAAAATAAGLPGDGTNAASMANLSQQLLASGATLTLDQAASSLTTGIGITVQQAQIAQSQSSASLLQAQNLQETQSGVSIEDQLLQLTRFQSGFQAAAKFISVVDQMLATLIQM